MQNPEDVQIAARALMDRTKGAWPDTHGLTGIILGTGLSVIGDVLSGDGVKTAFSELPNFPPASVDSHSGMFLAGCLSGLPVIIQQGRCHLYEGRSPREICMGVRVMASIGVRTLIITNAAGALNPFFIAGTAMLIGDIINYTGISPLTGINCDAWGDRFPDMSCPFDVELRQIARQEALSLGMRLEEGVYIGVHGPEMETPAETRMYRQWGADAVGMSTVLEVIAARHCGMRVLGISCLTNKNLPDCMQPAPIEEVIATANRTGKEIAELIGAVCQRLAR